MPGVSKRVLGACVKDALAITAANHHAKYMWRHFQPEAFNRYRYTQRTKGYVRRKLRTKGHNRPLVWSGQSEVLAKIRDVRSTRNRATLIQHARGLNRRKPTSLVQMNKEIRAVADPETREATRIANLALAAGLKNSKATKTTRVA